MFGFPEIAHKKFKQNFLRTVIFNFNYNAISYDLKANSNEIYNLFKDVLPSPIEVKDIQTLNISIGNEKNAPILEAKNNLENGVVLILKSKDNNKVLTITNHTISYTIAKSGYDSFIETKKELEIIKTFIEKTLKVTDLSSVNLRKINVVEINLQDKKSGQLTYNIFNDIIEQGNLNNPNVDFVLNNITVLTMKNNQNGQLILKYGINSPTNIPGLINHILIDIDIQILNNDVKGLSKNLESANKESFNIFNWVISDNFKEILNT